MALYKYKVADPTGVAGEQLVEADSQRDATRRLQQRGLHPICFLGEGAAQSDAQPASLFHRGFDATDFTDRLVPLLQAGIPLETSLGILADSHENAASRAIISDLRKGLHEGRPLSQMLRDRGNLFPELYASLIEVGEESGAMTEITADLRDFLNRRRDMKSYILSVSIYPLVVLAVSLLVLGVLLGVIVPRFADVLQTAGIEMSGSLTFLIAVSGALRAYWWIFILAIVGAVALAPYVLRNTQFVQFKDRILLSIPIVRKMVLCSNLAQLTRTMAIMLRNGSHILQTMSLSTKVVRNTVLKQSLGGISTGLRRGQQLSEMLGKSPHVPPVFLRMLAVGEETGDVATMLTRISERLEKEHQVLITRCLSFLEPVVIVVLGLIIGLIVITMFLAIMDMQAGI